MKKDGTVAWLRVFLTVETKVDAPVALRGIIIDVTKLKLTEELLTRSLQEKEILYREVHHRVKNDPSVISSLLNLPGPAY